MSQFWNGEVLAAPNLITVCVDESQASEISGRLYHGYSQEPQSFENVVHSFSGILRGPSGVHFGKACDGGTT